MLLFPRETSPPGLFCSNSNETHVRALSSWRQDPAPPASPHLRRRWVYNSSQGSVNYNPASCLPLFLFSSFRLGLLARSPRLSTAESLYLFPRKPRLVCFPLASFFLFALIEPLVNPGTWKPEKHGPESHLFTSCFPVFPISCLVFFFQGILLCLFCFVFCVCVPKMLGCSIPRAPFGVWRNRVSPAEGQSGREGETREDKEKQGSLLHPGSCSLRVYFVPNASVPASVASSSCLCFCDDRKKAGVSGEVPRKRKFPRMCSTRRKRSW